MDNPDEAYLIDLEAIRASRERWREIFRRKIKQDLEREALKRRERKPWRHMARSKFP